MVFAEPSIVSGRERLTSSVVSGSRVGSVRLDAVQFFPERGGLRRGGSGKLDDRRKVTGF